MNWSPRKKYHKLVALARDGCDCEESGYFNISPYGRLRYESEGNLKFRRIAMTTEQVEKFELPENPTPSSSKKDRKIRQSFIKFVSGKDRDIELNALKEFERDYLENLIEGSIKEFVDFDLQEKIENQIERGKTELREKIRIERIE